jgi:L-ascorbate metabolism protein UlaG (beta-lactamase superfamily)
MKNHTLKIQLIRNACLKISLNGKIILTDPMLSPRHGIESFAGKEKNPTVELPLPIEEILEGVDMVLVSHVHQDHFDKTAMEIIPKDIPVFCTAGYEDKIKEGGFSRVTPIEEEVVWEGIRITKTPGYHAGKKKWQDILGPVAGFLLKADGVPHVYWPGDTILCDAVETLIKEEQPDIILPHCCGAVLDDSGPIVMDDRMARKICELAPDAKVVAIHMEALDHATVTRDDLKDMAEKNRISPDRFFIPADGDTLEFV